MPLARFSAFPPAELVILDRRMPKQSVLACRRRQEERITEQQAASKLENMNNFLAVFERGPNTALWMAMILASEGETSIGSKGGMGGYYEEPLRDLSTPTGCGKR
ncbi:hypothetical protein QBC36DRAFT_366151 [Triangularia setosa]|uniref:Uncharacterized protein n=1 Tax=Triangularia setosa TaxID=2587417 RepID=A0AAN6VXJ6_9PEZI|nr:hypothetical protein QBC36DRAFT_366151 [Podospora setosa]